MKILIKNCHLLDLDLDVDQPPVLDIFIDNGTIAAIGTDAAGMAANQAGVEFLDGTNRLAIPGLVNAHYHSHDVFLRGLFEQMPLDIWGFYSFPSNYSRASNPDIFLRTMLGATECLLNGVTTVQDMVTVVAADRDHVEQIAAAYNRSGIRTVLGLQISDRAAAEAVPYWDQLSDRSSAKLANGSDVRPLQSLICELARGREMERLSWALAPSAPQRCTDELLRWVAQVSDLHGLQVFTHLYEARSQAVLARTSYPNGSLLDHLEKFGLLSNKLTIAHGVWIDDDELSRFGAVGANLAFNPMSNMKLLNGFAPVRKYIENGANVSLGCDNCSGSDVQSLLQSMKMFAMYWSMQSPAGESGAAKKAFHAATLGGAKALGLEGKIGALRVGYRADVVLIDLETPFYRPLNSAVKQLVYSETGSSIDSVIVDGRVLVRAGELVDHSKRELKESADAARKRLIPEIAVVAQRNAEIVPDLLTAYRKADEYELPFDRFSMR